MGEKLVIGPINRGLRTGLEPFNIDNDSFPTLVNAYQWRGRVKRKRGTSFINRLQRILGETAAVSGDFTITILPVPLIPALSSFQIGGFWFTDGEFDPLVNPVNLITNATTATATLDRSTGQLIVIGGGEIPLEDVIYYPGLPVMGLEDLILPTQAYPGTMAFDTHYSYLVSNNTPYTPADATFYKNPGISALSLPGYIPKTTQTPFYWNGENYQQFWSANYQGAFWATNGARVPFQSGTGVGMQFKAITGVAIITAGNGTNIPAVADLTIVAHGLVQGDFVFVNEVNGIPGINFQTGYVTSADPQAANLVRVTFPFAILTGAYTDSGIAQYLTNTADPTRDCLRWYDGNGWVNFSPPLSQFNYSINNVPAAKYYLVGAKIIFPFKDRLLFFGPIIQTSSSSPSPIYLPDTCCFSFNGTAFYNSSFSGDPLNFSTVFRTILAPPNQTADPRAYWEDQTGFGGFQAAGVDQAITSVSPNEDSLITGFRTNFQMRFVYTGNDLKPFDFFIVNSELGTASTFSTINLDEGVLTRGDRGFIITAQTNCQRFDLDIPDSVFQISNQNNGAERVTAQRDFINEWIYFSYPSNDIDNVFPNETLFYNYRDDSWATFVESYTTYGIFRAIDGYTWENIGQKYETWGDWNEPWSAGASTPLKPKVIAGNQQGFIMMRDQGTDEQKSLYIQNIVGSTVTCVNHCLNEGDFFIIEGAVGPFGDLVNGKIFSVNPPDNPTHDPDIEASKFELNPNIPAGTYQGGAYVKRLYIPSIYSRQFPVAWELARKTRLGVQQYLFTKTDVGQVTLLIFLSQMAQSTLGASNSGPIVPIEDSPNDGLIYSQILYTCPESTNLGLTPANVNLQQANAVDSNGSSANTQKQIWHRMNTSLIGDTVQFGFTLSEEQMRDVDQKSQEAEIEFHSAILDLNPSSLLS